MRIRFSFWWILFLPLFFYFHMAKTLFFMFLMLSIHECAHMLIAYLFHYPIEGVIIYPFGLCAQMQHIGMGNVWKELLIIVAGPLTHLFFPYLFQMFVSLHLISDAYLMYLMRLNQSIVLFNLLPVYPLDGGRIVQSLYHMVFHYMNAQRLTLITSVINLFLLFHYGIVRTWSSLIVMGFLLTQICMAWKQIGLERLAFYQYRKAHPVALPIRSNCKQDLYRAYTNLMKQPNGWISEEEWLHKHFQDDDAYHQMVSKML